MYYIDVCEFFIFSNQGSIKLNGGIYDVPINVGTNQNPVMQITDDVCLQQTLTNHSIYTKAISGTSGCDGNYNMGVLHCDASQVNQILTELQSCPNVTSAEIETVPGVINNSVNLNLLDYNNGAYVSTNSNIVQTNNADLNAIFQTYKVYCFVNSTATCNNCDVYAFMNALNNLTSVVGYSSLKYYVGLLSNQQSYKNSTTIYPNPFEKNITIETNETISNYSLTDILGKKIINTNSKNKFDNKTEQIYVGIYLLNLTFENGKTTNYKLIKD